MSPHLHRDRRECRRSWRLSKAFGAVQVSATPETRVSDATIHHSPLTMNHYPLCPSFEPRFKYEFTRENDLNLVLNLGRGSFKLPSPMLATRVANATLLAAGRRTSTHQPRQLLGSPPSFFFHPPFSINHSPTFDFRPSTFDYSPLPIHHDPPSPREYNSSNQGESHAKRKRNA